MTIGVMSLETSRHSISTNESVGVSIMLLQDLTQPKLCNETQFKVIETKIFSRNGCRERPFIPNIP